MPQSDWSFLDSVEQPTMQTQPQSQGGIGSDILRNTARLSTIAGEAALMPADIVQGLAQAKLPDEREANPYKLPNLMGESQVQPREKRPQSPFGVEQRVQEVPESQQTKLPWQGLPSEAFRAAVENKLPEGWLKPQGEFIEPSLDAAARFIPAVMKAVYSGGASSLYDMGKVVMSSVALGNIGQAVGGKEGRWMGEVAGPIFYGLAQLGKKATDKFYKDPTSPIENKVIQVKDDLYSKAGKTSKNIPVDSTSVFNNVNQVATEHAERLPMKESKSFLQEVGRLQNRYFPQQVSTIGGRTIPAAKHYGKFTRYPGESTMNKLIDAKVFANGQIQAAKDPRIQEAWRSVSNAISNDITKQGQQFPQFYETFKRADELHGMLQDAGKAQELINQTIMKMEPDGPLTRWAKKGLWGFANQAADIFTPSGSRSTIKQAKLYFKVPEVRRLIGETAMSAIANDPIAVQAHLNLLNNILKEPTKQALKSEDWSFL